MGKIIEWINPKDNPEIYTFDYWNNIEEEKKKELWIENGNYEKFLAELQKSGFLTEFQDMLSLLQNKKLLKGDLLDLAAGVCWTSSILSRIKSVARIDALDFSRHRLEILAPEVFKAFNAEISKIQTIFGSFYDIKSPEKSYDGIVMTRSFHHAEKPLSLLIECDRVLKPGGFIALTGESPVSKFRYFKRIVKIFLKTFKLQTDFHELFKPDEMDGDRYYRLDDYYFLFNSLGYSLSHYKTNLKDSLAFIAIKNN